MKTFDEMDYHPVSEQLAQILCAKTQNTNPLFFRVMIGYYWSVLASTMRCKIVTEHRGELPVNLFAINLAPSGSGKGYSTNVIEDQVIYQFRHNFLQRTMPIVAEKHMLKLANERAITNSTEPDDELAKAKKEFDKLGPMLFSFDSGTSPAIKQARQKLLMADCGALNFQMDEIGSNLMANSEALSTFLELFDVGKIKQKLVKNTAENARYEEINGRTPTNMMLFGTPSRLLDGGKVEEEFFAMNEEGYARRCFYGFARGHSRRIDMTPAEILAEAKDNSTNTFIDDLSDHLGGLADMGYLNKKLHVSEDVSLLFIEYQLECERQAEAMDEHEDMKKAELAHRHFKALKLAGAYAFIDDAAEITEDHAYYAIKIAEESGRAFNNLLTRDKAHVKLAKYLASREGRLVTQADLVEDLPFYRGSVPAKQEMMTLAIAYGYQNSILIKKQFSDGVEFLTADALKPTDLSNLRVSYSQDIARDYGAETVPWDQLYMLGNIDGIHWCNHFMKDGHRCEDNAIPGFNVIVLDVEKSVSLDVAKQLLAEYKALYYITKRYTQEDQRFRIILPMNYELELDAKDYKDFMKNVFDWLPFAVDTATGQRARKWLSHQGHYEYNDGEDTELIDVLPFIPKTSKCEAYRQRLMDQSSMDNMERWVLNNTGDGNRNEMLHRYGRILVDSDLDYESIRQRVLALNGKLDAPLDEAEIMGTVMVTVGVEIGKRSTS